MCRRRERPFAALANTDALLGADSSAKSVLDLRYFAGMSASIQPVLSSFH
jgi:hypothetical protein